MKTPCCNTKTHHQRKIASVAKAKEGIALLILTLAICQPGLKAAPSPNSDLALSAGLSGVSTWSGERRPGLILDMKVQGDKVAMAGYEMGGMVLNRTTGEVIRRFVPSTLSSSGSGVALAGDRCLLNDGPYLSWFGTGVGATEGGEIETISYGNAKGVASLGSWGVGWTESYGRNNTRVQVFDMSQASGPQLSVLLETAYGRVLDLQICEVEGTLLAVIKRLEANSEILELHPLNSSGSLSIESLTVPSLESRFHLAPDGRLAVFSGQSVSLYQVTAANDSFTFTSVTTVPVEGLHVLTDPFLGDSLLAVQTFLPDRIAFYDLSNFATPQKISDLPLPLSGRYGNSCQMVIDGNRLVFADYYGALREADLTDPSNPEWASESLQTGQTTQATHNGPWVLTNEGVGRTVRLIDLNDPATPETLASIATTGNVIGPVWAGHMAYSIEISGAVTLSAMDLSDPSAPRTMRQEMFGGSISSIRGLAADGKVLVVCEGGSRDLWVYSLEIPEYPHLIARIPANPWGSFESVALHNGVAYVVAKSSNTNTTSLVPFNLSDPKNPQTGTALPLEQLSNVAESLEIVGNRLINNRSYALQGTPRSIEIFDLSDPLSPTSLGMAPPVSPARQVTVAGGFLFGAGYNLRSITPWGNIPHYESYISPVTISESGLEIGAGTEQFQVRPWYSVSGPTTGRKADPGKIHVIGDLVLQPVGYHGLDIMAANFLTRSGPKFVHQPTPRTVAATRRAVLSATIDGALPITMQWFKGTEPLSDGGKFSGSRDIALVIDPVDIDDAGEYHLELTNSEEVATSNPVTLSVIPTSPLRLEVEVTAGNALQFHAEGNPGQVIALERSRDLGSWTRVIDPTSSVPVDIWISGQEDTVSLPTVLYPDEFFRYSIIRE